MILLRKGFFCPFFNITNTKPSGYIPVLSKDCKKETDILKGLWGCYSCELQEGYN